MVMARIVLSLVLVGATACSAGNVDPQDDARKTDSFQDQTFLTLVGFTGSVVRREKRFSGYSSKAQRVSLIDPETETEVWGRQLPGTYEYTAPLSDYSGVALLSGQTLSIVTDKYEKVFAPIEFPIGFVTRAQSAPTYAAVSQDGQRVHVVRQYGQGEWQEETFTSPFDEPPGFSAPPDTEPPLGVALLSANGEQLLYFMPADGRYAYYSTDVAGGKINPVPRQVCEGDGVGQAGKASYRSILLDAGTPAVAVTGDRLGVVSVFDPMAPCVEPKARPTLNLGDNLPITDLTVADAGRLGVTQVGGRLHVVNYGLAGFQEPKTITDVCLYPLGALPVGQDGMALVCIGARDLDTEERRQAAPASVQYDEVSVQLVSLVSGLPIFQRALDVEQTAGAALDPDRGRVLILKDSPIGILNVLDLSTGAQHTRKGLFLDDILD
jgi:hypothetical protein